MKKSIFLALLLLFVVALPAQNAAEMDTSFATEGWFGITGTVKKIAHRADGKIMVCGIINSYKGIPVNNIFRINSDGSLDTSFNPGATFASDVRTFEFQTDGKVIVAGNSENVFGIKRLNEDGSLDSTFNVSFNYPAQCFGIQTDGKILIGADTNTLLSKVIRLNTNGTLDSSFNLNAPSITFARCIMVESGGKIIVGGESTSSLNAPSLVRLNSGGDVDATFSSGVFSTINTLSKQPDGKIIVGGKLRFGSSLGDFHNVGRIMANGQIDASFSPGNVNLIEVYASAIRDDGKILIGGRFTIYNGSTANNIACLNTDGSIDTSFNSGIGLNHHVYALDAYSGNTFFAGGDFNYYNTADSDSIILIDADGGANIGFTTGRVIYTQVSLAVVCAQTDGKIIVAGGFDYYNNASSRKITRFNSDGSIDNSFDVGSGFNYDSDYATVHSVALQSDGRIIVAGKFNHYDGTPVSNLVRLNIDGTLDNTFTNGNAANFNYLVHELLIQPDGKIIAIGTNYNNYNSDYIVRLNQDGTLDTSFNATARFNSAAEAMAIQSDGKIIVGGRFSTFNTEAAPGIIRLNPDGTVDSTFNTGSGFNTSTSSSYVRALKIQEDGKIIVGGYLTNFNGATTTRHLFRLNSNGTIDTSFDQGSGLNGSVLSLDLDSESKLLVGGNFTSYNGANNNHLIRINADGVLDSLFNVGLGFNSAIANISSLSNGKIIVAGAFSSYNGSVAKQIIRLKGSSLLATHNSPLINKMSFYSNPVKDFLQVKLDDLTIMKSYTIIDSSGKEIKSETTSNFNNKIDVTVLSKGIYLLKVDTNHGRLVEKFIKE